MKRIRNNDLQIVGKRCINYASQDGPTIGDWIYDSTGATWLPRKSTCRRYGDLSYLPVRTASLMQLTRCVVGRPPSVPVVSGI